MAESIGAEDRALIETLARRIAELRMETPAILAIEGGRPLSLVAGQAMLFFEPFVQALFRLGEYRRWAALIERREGLEVLVECIEAAVDAREKAARS